MAEVGRIFLRWALAESGRGKDEVAGTTVGGELEPVVGTARKEECAPARVGRSLRVVY
jgi:hypothetical protein